MPVANSFEAINPSDEAIDPSDEAINPLESAPTIGTNRAGDTRLEAWAEIEQHFQEQDRRIAAWLAPSGSRRLNVARVANWRETNFLWWTHLEDRARMEPRTLGSRDRAAREYLDGYVRPSVHHACLMERACPTWLIWSTVWIACLWFFVPALFPGVVDFLKGLL